VEEFKPSFLSRLIALPGMLLFMPSEFAAERRSRTLGTVVIDEIPPDPRITTEVLDRFRASCDHVRALGFEHTVLVQNPAPRDGFDALFWHAPTHTAAHVYLFPGLPRPPGVPPPAPRISVAFANNFTLVDGSERSIQTSDSDVRPLWPDPTTEIQLSLPHISSPSELLAAQRALVRRHGSGTPNPRRTAADLPSFVQMRFDQMLQRWHKLGLIRFDPTDPDAYFYTMKGARRLVWSRVGLIGDVLNARHARRNRKLVASLS
jgi:hypothetical protein